VGNFRLDAVTFALGDSFFDAEHAFAIFVFRGRYERERMKGLLESFGMNAAKVAGQDVLFADDEFLVLLESDERLVMFAGMSGEAVLRYLREWVAPAKPAAGRLPDNLEMVAVLESIDRTQPLWLAAVMSETYRQLGPLLKPFDTITLTAARKGEDLHVTVVAKGKEGAALDRAEKMIDEGVKMGVQVVEAQAEKISFLRPVVAMMKSIDRRRDGGTVTVTAKFEDVVQWASLPMFFPVMVAAF
jgi:hypothetical protein